MKKFKLGEEDIKERIRSILNLKKPKFYIIGATVVILAIVIVGLITNPADNSAWLTEKEIVNTFNAHNLALEKDNRKTPAAYAIDGIEPGIFRLKEYDGTLYIYIFGNLNERSDKYDQWKLAESNKTEFDGWSNAYHSKNATIVLEVPVPDTDDYSKISKLENIIADTVFLHLNEGKTIVYHGESENWRGTYTLKYYNNPIEDENGRLYMDNYGWETSQLTYLGGDLANVGNISYKYDRAGSGGEGTGLRINDKGIVNLAGSSGNGAISNPPQEVTITVMWNDQKESLVLRP
jgi:hypothetical protein